MSIEPDELLIDDDNWTEHVDSNVDGEVKGKGLVPRDYAADPPDMYEPPSVMDLIPRSEWSARIKEMEATKSRLSDVRLRGNKGGPIPSLDQGNRGYCWAHSTVHAVMLQRALDHQPYVALSAYMVACIIKNYADQGGWCGLSQKFLRDHGVCSQKLWPQGGVSRSLDTPEARADAARYKVTEEWVDLTRDVWNTKMTFDQVMTCLLTRTPMALDFNWWGHSVEGLDPVEVESGSFGIRIWNSWSDKWGDRGMGILRGDKAIPNGAVAIRSIRAAA